MDKRVSIIVPLYNKEKYIRTTIQSVLNQTYKNFELLVVDDGSTDDGSNIVKSINDKRIRYIYKENGGVSSARNQGVDMAVSEWIMFLDADDTLEENCLEALLHPILNGAEMAISAATFYVERDGHKSIERHSYYSGVVADNYKWLFLRRYFLRAGSFLIRRDIVLKNKFDECLSRYEDMKCILEWIRNAKIIISDIPVMTYKTDNCSLSGVAKDISRDFIFSMEFDGKGFWEKCILGELLYFGLISYPRYRSVLLSQYRCKAVYALIAKIQMFSNHFHRWNVGK